MKNRDLAPVPQAGSACDLLTVCLPVLSFAALQADFLEFILLVTSASPKAGFTELPTRAADQVVY